MKLTISKVKVFALIVTIASAAALPAIAQDAQQPGFPVIPAPLEKKLAARASSVKEVTLDKNMLNFGSQFLSSKQQDEHEAQQIIHNLNGIYIRKYEFDQPGAYTEEDVKEISDQFHEPQWSPIVRKSGKGEDTKDIYFKMVHGEIHGIAILKAEPRELTLIDISGEIDMKDLSALSGNFGIPNVNTGGNSTKSTK
jgi:hypothetical protein